MKVIDKQEPGYLHTKNVVYLFGAFAVISFIYALSTRSYNGDFIDRRASLGVVLMVINLILTLLPLFLLWKAYLFFKKRETSHVVPIPLKIFEYFVFVLLILNLVVTIAFGVGKAATEFYEAPALIKPFIQILNRLDFVYISLLFILLSTNRTAIYRTTILIIVISILKASIGIFLFVFLVFGLKYFAEIREYMRTRKKVLVVVLFIFPFFIQSLYEIRDQIRQDDKFQQQFSVPKFFFGKLTGRLSSFSNSAIIIQEALYFSVKAKSLEDYYFQKQAIGGVLGANFLPHERPEFIMIQILDGSPNKRVAFMCGTQGNLMIAALKSFKILTINILTIGFLVLLTFWLIRLLGFKYATEFAVILLIYPLTSGVANEFSMVAFSSLFLVILFLLINAGIASTTSLMKTPSTQDQTTC